MYYSSKSTNLVTLECGAATNNRVPNIVTTTTQYHQFRVNCHPVNMCGDGYQQGLRTEASEIS